MSEKTQEAETQRIIDIGTTCAVLGILSLRKNISKSHRERLMDARHEIISHYPPLHWMEESE
jgi:tRNA1(Val) A37 N6-methylase TrmN6